MKKMNKAFLLATGSGLGFVASGANAAIDTTATVAAIAGNETAILAVGGALIALAAVCVGIKWVKGTVFS